MTRDREPPPALAPFGPVPSQGRQFDANGNLKDWWTAEDSREFDQREACVVNEYSRFTVAGVNVNGKLTLSENTADNGGARVALMALENRTSPTKLAR